MTYTVVYGPTRMDHDFMSAPNIEVVGLTELRLASGVCDACGAEGWVILIIIHPEKPHAFYVCDKHRRELIEKLAVVS